MSRQRIIPALVLALTVLTWAGSVLPGPYIPATLSTAAEDLVLNGQGERTRLFITLYAAGLYLQKKNNNAPDIVAAEKPMAMRLVIRSSLITSEKMENATLEGFARSTAGNTAPLQNEINRFISVFREDIREKDIYEMIYLPDIGVTVRKNGKTAAVIPGPAFKKALFGIWLGRDPVQESLKKELLGGEE